MSRTANWAAAADYINQTYGQGLKKPLASLGSLMFSRPGVIEFKVYSVVFGSGGLPALKARIVAVHGSPTSMEVSSVGTAYTWWLTPERAVVCGHRWTGRKGLYIQLKDFGD